MSEPEKTEKTEGSEKKRFDMKKLKQFTAETGHIKWILLALLAFMLVNFSVRLIAPGSGLARWFRRIFSNSVDRNTISAVLASISRGVIYCLLIYAGCYIARRSVLKILNRSERGKSYSQIVSGVIKYSGAIAIILIILDTCGVNTTALWASVGALGLIIGLGCQTLIADIVAGVFIVFEDVFRVGEIVIVDDFRGTVLEIGIRSVKIKNGVGDIKIVNNSNVKGVVNLSRELSTAGCAMSTEYGESLERIEEVIKEALPTLRETIPNIVDGPFYLGVTGLKDSCVEVKVVAKCLEQHRFGIELALNREMKLLFDRNNINIPFPQITVNHRPEDPA